MSWTDCGDYVMYDSKFKVNTTNKLAGFDLDSTLIKTKSGSRFAKDKDDWVFVKENVPEILENLYNQGYNIVIITNQSKFNTDIRDKITNIISNHLKNIPILVYVANGSNKYRKPMTGFQSIINEKFPIDLKNSFYVGDAMDSKLDHSNCDLLFAKNLAIEFKYFAHFFEIKTSRNIPLIQKINLPKPKNVDISNYNVVITVGAPASGKTTFANENNSNFYQTSKDKFAGNKSKFYKDLETALKANKNIIIDNTSPDKETRLELIQKIKENRPSAKILVLHFNISRNLCEHLNYYRCNTINKLIPSIVYNIYYKKFTDPKQDNFVDVSVEDYIPAYSDNITDLIFL